MLVIIIIIKQSLNSILFSSAICNISQVIYWSLAGE